MDIDKYILKTEYEREKEEQQLEIAFLMKRISKLEEIVLGTFFDGSPILDENDKPIVSLVNEVKFLTSKKEISNTNPKDNVFTNTKREARAHCLYKALHQAPKNAMGNRYLTTTYAYNYLSSENTPTDIKVTKDRNKMRSEIIGVMKKVTEIYKDTEIPSQKKGSKRMVLVLNVKKK